MKSYFVTWIDHTGIHTAIMSKSGLAKLIADKCNIRVFQYKAVEQDYL